MNILAKVINKIFPSKQARRVKPWMIANGDKTLRLTYALDERSIVFDLGGFEGQWASDIFSKYQCKIFVFEPFPKYCSNIRERFLANKNIKVFEFGLGKENKRMTLYSNDDASSVFKKEGNPFDIEIRKATTFIKENNITVIDLLKINIEGGEYDLLEELISGDHVKIIKNIQVQFHDFVPDANSRMKEIQNLLSVTHSLTYQYEFVWENWEIKR